MFVDVTIRQLEAIRGIRPDSLSITCARCKQCVVAFGTRPKSLRWGLHQLRERCPQRERNYYGPPRFDFVYYGDDPLTERIRAAYEAKSGILTWPAPKRPARPAYGLTPDSEWERLDAAVSK